MRYILALFCISALIFAKDVNVATYNVENLFDGVNQGSEYRDFRLGKHGWNKQIAQKKLDNTIQAIKAIDADILALQEVENEAILKRLAQKTGFLYTAFTKPSRSPVGVGVMSNYPIKKVKNFKAGIEKTRDFLYTKIEIDGNMLGFWVVHFPTQKYPISQRKRVANHLKKAINSQNDTEYIIAGDFNTPIKPNSILEQSFGSFGVGKNLYDPWLSIPSDLRWSRSFFGKKSAYDRMLLSKGLFDGKKLDFKKNSFKAVRQDFLLNHKKEPNRWQMRGKRGDKKHIGKGYSDHLPLILTLTTKVQKQDTQTVDMDTLFKMPAGKTDVKLEKVVVIYKNKLGVILGQNARGIYLHKPGFELKKFYMYDVEVRGLKDYQKRREIASIELLKEYGKVENIKPYYQQMKNFKNTREGDVIEEVSGVVEGRILRTPYGNIPLFLRDKKVIFDGEKLNLKGVRVSKYGKRLELVIEETR